MNAASAKGIVHLVGAGPGDPELITVKGLRLVETAEVLVYDALVADELILKSPANCERIFAGKRSGCHSLAQSKIEQILIQKARAGKRVVRLKGGDPFMFGRGGEEALALRHAGIAYSIVPAVTAALAAGAYSGIPLTHRGLSTGVVFISGHEEAGTGKLSAPFEVCVAEALSLCIYMGIGKLEKICAELLRCGRKPETPSAVIQWAGCPQQKVLYATLGTLNEAVLHSGMGSPSIVIIGKVVTLGPQLNWIGD
jgi:uroporphyrinogen III methyltransferase/synthase